MPEKGSRIAMAKAKKKQPVMFLMFLALLFLTVFVGVLYLHGGITPIGAWESFGALKSEATQQDETATEGAAGDAEPQTPAPEDPVYVRLRKQQEKMRNEFSALELMQEKVVREKNILQEERVVVEKMRAQVETKLQQVEDRLALLRAEETRMNSERIRSLVRMCEKMEPEAALKLMLKLDDQTMVDVLRVMRQANATEIIQLMTETNLDKAVGVAQALAVPPGTSMEIAP